MKLLIILIILLNNIKMNTTLKQVFIELYNEFKSGKSISELSTLHQVTNTEMYNLVQIGKRLCQ